MKRMICLLLTLILALGLLGAAAEQSYTAGTYTATAQGNNGDVTVEVEVSDLSGRVHARVCPAAPVHNRSLPRRLFDGADIRRTLCAYGRGAALLRRQRHVRHHIRAEKRLPRQRLARHDELSPDFVQHQISPAYTSQDIL